MTEKVLFVDDDSNVLSAYTRQLRKRFDFHTAKGAAQALGLLQQEGPFAVVVSDMKMPGMNGIALLCRVKELYPNVIRMMLTANIDQRTAVDAVNAGHIFRFYTKPCAAENLAAAIEDALAQYRLQAAERELLEKTLAGSVKVLVDVLALVDPEGFGRTKLLRSMARDLAARLKLPSAWQLDVAAMLSPIGRITLPGEVMRKLRIGAKLTEPELAMVARVPEIGRDLIANIPRLEEVSEMIWFQAKGFDGSGFPDVALAATDIPIGARILRLLNDLIDASGGQPCGPASFDLLAENAQLYDAALLATAREIFLGEAEAETETAQESLPLPIAKLRAGDQLVSNIETESGSLVLAAGSELTTALLAKLSNLNKMRRLKQPIYVARAAPADAGPEEITAVAAT